MAVEKAALDLTECGIEVCRQGLNSAVDELENVLKSVSKRAVRQRIRKAAEKVKFDQIIVVDPSK